jgi:N-acetylmuramoyl-L-alanine amidase
VAEQAKANVFVSIHGNALSTDQPDANGLETYHYPGSVSGASLAQAIQTSILHSVDVRDRGVRQANFYVLRHTSMPAALVEVGFLTGQQDSQNLSQPDYRSKLARAIANGILQYIAGTGY